MDIALILAANWWQILLAAVSTFILGFIWYHPATFGKIWMRDTGLTEEDAKKGNMPMIFGVSFVMSVLIGIYMARYPHGGAMHVVHSFLMWAFVVAPVLINNSLFEQRPWSVILINIGYWLVALMVMTMIINGLGEMPDYPPHEEEASRMIPQIFHFV